MSKKGNPSNLTAKQKRFCQEYVKDSNGTKAFIRAGFSEKGASVGASRLLGKDNVKEYLSSLKKEVAEKIFGETESLAEHWKRVFDMTAKIPKLWVSLEEYKAFPEEWKECIDHVLERTKNIGTPDFPEYQEQAKVVLYDKLKVGNELGKMTGAYEIDNKQKGESGKVVIFKIPDNGRG